MFSKNTIDDAVSPVVGVILMVAVTVILAAVIASFVLDLGSNVQANPSAGVTFSEVTDGSSNNAVEVQVVALENADSLTVTGDVDSDYTISSVGETAVLGDSGWSSPDATLSDDSSGSITVTGTLDGKTSVIQTYDYNF